MPVEFIHPPRPSIDVETLKICLRALLGHSKKARAILEVRLVGRKSILTLNRRYLRKEKVTDVLSFPLDPEPVVRGGPWHLGEIVIATPVARLQAKRAGRTLEQQLLRLSVHGFVHLQGLDHERSEKERLEFEKLEKKYLRFLDRKGWMPWDGLLQF